MKKSLLTTVVAIAALSSGAAFAQQDHKGGNKPDSGQPQSGQHPGGQQGGDHRRGGQGGSAGGQGGQGGQGGSAGGHGGTLQVHPVQPSGGHAPTGHIPGLLPTTPQGGHPTGGRGPGSGPVQTYGSPGRNAGQDRGHSGFQFQYRGQHRDAIRRGDYRYPNGWGYRRWNNGQILPFLFLSQTYFFSDYMNYGFGPPPYGYVWVRYGPDLLLVNRRTGRIREVIYGVFY